MRREKRRRQTSTSSDEELADRKGSRAKLRRHESDSSDEDHGHILRRNDARAETLGEKRNTSSHERDSIDDAAPRASRRTRDESDEDMQDRPSITRVALGRKDENFRTTLGRDARDDQKNERRPPVENDRSVDERERKYGRAHDSSPRQRHKHDDREERGSDRGGRAYNREVGNSRWGRDSDSDEDTRRHKGGNDFRRQKGRDELSRRDDSKDMGRHRRRSPSPVRRKPRRDSD